MSQATEGEFSIINNQHVYYQIQDPEILLHSLKNFMLEERTKTPEERSFKPSDELVYRVGLILREHASEMGDLWMAYLAYLPPQLSYGALWYSDTDFGRSILSSESESPDPRRARLAAAFSAAPAPKPGIYNALVPGARISRDDKTGYIQELWAAWFTHGTRESLLPILEKMDREKAKRCLAITDGKTPEQVSELYKRSLAGNARRVDEAMLVGSMAYDSNLRDLVKSILFPSVPDGDVQQ